MKNLTLVSLGFLFFTAAALANDNSTSDNNSVEKDKTTEEVTRETPTLLKCFATPKGFFYMSASIAALFRAGWCTASAYENFTSNTPRKISAISGLLAEVLAMLYLSHRAFKDISKTCR